MGRRNLHVLYTCMYISLLSLNSYYLCRSIFTLVMNLLHYADNISSLFMLWVIYFETMSRQRKIISLWYMIYLQVLSRLYMSYCFGSQLESNHFAVTMQFVWHRVMESLSIILTKMDCWTMNPTLDSVQFTQQTFIKSKSKRFILLMILLLLVQKFLHFPLLKMKDSVQLIQSNFIHLKLLNIVVCIRVYHSYHIYIYIFTIRNQNK